MREQTLMRPNGTRWGRACEL